MIQFTLTELDSSYAGIRVYFAHFDGRDEATMEVLKLTMYSHGDTDSIVISHTGLEDVSLVDSSEINSGFTPRYNNDSHYYKRQTSPWEHLLLSVNQIYQLWRMLR
jgi:hypothetical protein